MIQKHATEFETPLSRLPSHKHTPTHHHKCSVMYQNIS